MNLTGAAAEPHKEDILGLLEAEPKSWERHFTLDYIWQRILAGSMIAWIYYDAEDEAQCVWLTQLNQYRPGLMSLQVLVATVRRPWLVDKMVPCVEMWAQQMGCSYVESIVHPTIAKWAVRKHGYSAPAIYVIKPLTTGGLQ